MVLFLGEGSRTTSEVAILSSYRNYPYQIQIYIITLDTCFNNYSVKIENVESYINAKQIITFYPKWG